MVENEKIITFDQAQIHRPPSYHQRADLEALGKALEGRFAVDHLLPDGSNFDSRDEEFGRCPVEEPLYIIAARSHSLEPGQTFSFGTQP